MDHMDFREIGKLIAENHLSPEYLWRNVELLYVPPVHPPNTIFIGDGEYGVKNIRKITCQFRVPDSPSFGSLLCSGSP
jgi:hypothetical protein